MGVVDKLNQIKSCKEDIKQAIIDKGVDMTDVAFTEYATKISEIQGGGGDYLDMRNEITTYYSTVESVGSYAFAKCINLQSVNLPKCVFVGSDAFTDCTSLQSVNLPVCMSLGGAAFSYCTSLQSIDLPNVIYLGGTAFTYCTSLQSVNLPVCSYINQQTFMYCSSLSVLDLRGTYSCGLQNSGVFNRTYFASGNGSIYVHNTVLSQFQTATNWTYFSNCFVGVGDPDRPLLSFDSGRVYGDTFALYSNYLSYLGITSKSISSIDLPNVRRLDSYTMFSYYSTLTHLSMSSLEKVLGNLCYTCSSLKSVNLPNCSYVGSLAFLNCSSLQSVNLPNCVSIGRSAFAYCSSLTSIDLPNCIYVGAYGFAFCKSLTSIDLPNCSYVSNYTFNSCSSLQSVNLPNCSYVGDNAFLNCSSLQSVNLPNCSYVGSSAFFSCSSLKSVNLPMCEYVGNNALYTYNNTIDTVYIGTSISKVCQAGGPQIFANNTTKGGYFINKIYVPMSLVSIF